MLREAYPGAIYYYMSRPYRVQQFKYREGEILVKPERYWTTEPIAQTMVFPSFQAGLLKLWVTADQRGFLAESSLQVSERVMGFKEKRGSAEPQSLYYEPGSPYYQRPVNNFFETTGVCWFFPDFTVTDEDAALLLREAFCSEFGIVERDVGVGMFKSRNLPTGPGEATGMCIYDAATGSLRLTEMLAEHFAEVVQVADKLADARGYISDRVHVTLSGLDNVVKDLVFVPIPKTQHFEPTQPHVAESKTEYATVIAPGERAVVMVDAPTEVTVVGYRYTPRGMMYDLGHSKLERWSVPASTVNPIYGRTKMLRVNLVTGEEETLGYYAEPPDKSE